MGGDEFLLVFPDSSLKEIPIIEKDCMMNWPEKTGILINHIKLDSVSAFPVIIPNTQNQ